MIRTYWDKQFKFSRIIPDFAVMLEKMAADSAALASNAHFERLRYGAHERQWVEWTEGNGPASLLPVLIHGGYWRAHEAEHHRFMIPGFLPFGASVANVEYRLVPEVRISDIVRDIISALDLLIGKFPSARLLLVGHSAGAHLALSALHHAVIAEKTKGVIGLSGVYDLHPIRHCFLQDELELTEEEARAHTLDPQTERPPVLYVNGSAETHEFLRGGATMARASNALWHVIPGANHMSLTWAARDSALELIQTLNTLGRIA